MNDHPIIKLLGETLLNQSNENIQTISLCGKDKFLGLYYSAYWCPSCIAFTPELVKFYKQLKSSENKEKFEIVYISSDPDEKHFKEHLSTMPWYALPFTDRCRQMDLARHYRVQSIPALVIVESDSAKLVTSSGRACVMDDPVGLWFPWRMREVAEILGEISLITSDEKKVPFESISSKIKGLYFSAHWCPPCKAFTPALVKLYKKIRKNAHKFEIIFISSDRSEDSFKQYFSNMPWLAVPYTEEKCRKELGHLYGVGGIPCLIILDENNSVITKEGRMEVNEDPDGEDFPWRPKLVDELGEKHISKLNEEPCLILFTIRLCMFVCFKPWGIFTPKSKATDPNEGKRFKTEACEDKELELAHYALSPVAEEYEARMKRASIEDNPIPHLNFFYAGDAEICDSVRDIIGFGDDFPVLVILDIPNGKKYIHEKKEVMTSDIIGKFVRDFISHKLTPCVIGN